LYDHTVILIDDTIYMTQWINFESMTNIFLEVILIPLEIAGESEMTQPCTLCSLLGVSLGRRQFNLWLLGACSGCDVQTSDDETDDVSASRPVQDSEDTGTPATTKPTQRIVQR
jgi:hypothetical protein